MKEGTEVRFGDHGTLFGKRKRDLEGRKGEIEERDYVWVGVDEFVN